MAYSSGSAPTNAATLTGTLAGRIMRYTNESTVIAADVSQPFSTQVVVVNLIVGTAYWIDLAAVSVSTASSVGLANIAISAVEL